MNQKEKFEALLQMLDDDALNDIAFEFQDQIQLARKIINDNGLGTPAESIRLQVKDQIKLALDCIK